MLEELVEISLTRKEFVLLVARYERSLEKDANREDNIDNSEFTLLDKLLAIK